MPGLQSLLAPPILSPDLRPLPRFLPALSAALAAAMDRCIELLMTWRQREADRAVLAEMNERDLRDVGLTRSEVLVEADKPFWRA